jgi:hypothetical protein
MVKWLKKWKEVNKMTKLRVMVTGLMLVALIVGAVAMAITPAPVAEAAYYPCVITGHAFGAGGLPVAAGTDILFTPVDGVPKMATTGDFGLADNQFYADGIMATPGTNVAAGIETFPGSGVYDPAAEVPVHVMYGYVVTDLHAGCASQHVDANPYLFCYPFADCDLPDAITNLVTDCTPILVWGTEEVNALNPGEEWISFDPNLGVGGLTPFGLEQGKPYVLTHEGDCICIDWEQCCGF